MAYGSALWAGVVGALALTILTAVGRGLGLPIDFELLLGTLVGLPPGAGAWLLGLLIHLLDGAAFGLLYAWGFHALGRRGIAVGVAFGLVHAVVAGLVIGGLPAIHPLVPTKIPAPGPFLANFGRAGVAAGFGLHLVYGVIVGALYAPAGMIQPAGLRVDADRPSRAA
jgi:hypothetical protein